MHTYTAETGGGSGTAGTRYTYTMDCSVLNTGTTLPRDHLCSVAQWMACEYSILAIHKLIR